MSRRKICLVAHHCNPTWGSEPLIGWRWASHLAERVDLTLITHVRNRQAIEAAGLEARVEYVDTERLAARVVRWNQRLWGRSAPVNHLILETVAQLAFDREAVRIAKRCVAAGRVDLIHRVSPISPRFPSRLGRLGVPFVIGPVNGGMRTAPGFDEVAANEREGILKLRDLTRLLDPLARTYSSADAVLVATETTRGALPRRLRSKAIHFPENAVLHDEFQPVFERDTDALNVLYLGRLLEYKGVQWVLRGFAQATERGLNGRLNIVGDGPARERLERLTDELELRPWVRFHGAVPVEQVSRAMRDADVYAFPSVRESGGSTVMEAMACGKPVIVADHGGPAETVDETCGIRVDARSPEELARGVRDALLELGSNEERRLEMGRAARARVERCFTWKGRVLRALDLYDDVLAAREASRSEMAPTLLGGLA